MLGLSLTGYLLPWDQKGFWATQVATNITANLPAVGPWLQRIVVGGPEYGHHTLARFYALHVVVLPSLVIGLIALHIFVFRRHGVTAPKNAVGEGWFWPDQAFRDMLVGLVILAVLVAVVLWGHGHAVDGPPAFCTQLQGSSSSQAPSGKQQGLDSVQESPMMERPSCRLQQTGSISSQVPSARQHASASVHNPKLEAPPRAMHSHSGRSSQIAKPGVSRPQACEPAQLVPM